MSNDHTTRWPGQVYFFLFSHLKEKWLYQGQVGMIIKKLYIFVWRVNPLPHPVLVGWTDQKTQSLYFETVFFGPGKVIFLLKWENKKKWFLFCFVSFQFDFNFDFIFFLLSFTVCNLSWQRWNWILQGINIILQAWNCPLEKVILYKSRVDMSLWNIIWDLVQFRPGWQFRLFNEFLVLFIIFVSSIIANIKFCLMNFQSFKITTWCRRDLYKITLRTERVDLQL